jgi:signal peptide peptidase-like protein 2B
MLGFGDVVLPGILVTFLRECDARLEEDQSMSSMLTGMDSAVARGTTGLPLSGSNDREGRRRWSYYLTAILGYAVGLELTFVAMMWSNQGQPALLYLVPCTVVPVVLFGVQTA